MDKYQELIKGIVRDINDGVSAATQPLYERISKLEAENATLKKALLKVKEELERKDHCMLSVNIVALIEQALCLH